MRHEIIEAVNTLTALRIGDRVEVTNDGRTAELTVSREASRSDGQFGSVESTHITVTYGVGRYAFEVRAESLAAGRQTIRKL